MLTQELVRSIFDYDNGNLIRKKGKKDLIGKIAGFVKKNGYSMVRVGKGQYLAHRIIFLYHYGFLPSEIDHMDGNPRNNKIENLRAASHEENIRNSKNYSTNKSGTRGVTWHKRTQKWQVDVQVNKKTCYVGIYEDKELAELVSIEARNLFYKEYSFFNRNVNVRF
jgi:hypothetical protein